MRSAIIFSLCAAICCAVFAAQRMVLGELATNTGCGPCVPANNLLDVLRISLWDKLCLIRYHDSGPSSSDPFYLRNTSQNAARLAYYPFGYTTTGVPCLTIDGTVRDDINYSYFESAINTRAAVSSPMTIDIEFVPSKDTGGGTVNLSINVETPVTGTNKLYYVLIENDIYYEAPNGQRWFYEVMREIWPSATGQTVDLSTVGVHAFSQSINFAKADEKENCFLVVFVQNNSTKEVYQSAKKCLADYEFVVSPKFQYAKSTSADTTATFTFFLQNIGINAETYTIATDPHLPSGWTAETYTETGVFSGSTSRTLAVEEVETLRVVMHSNSRVGTGFVNFQISGDHIGGSPYTVMALLATSPNVLLVDDDAGAFYEWWYIYSLQNIGARFAYYSVAAGGSPSLSFLSQYDAVIWFTGDAYSNTITTTDQSNLTTYLNSGKRLFVTGQDIGYEIGSTTFYQNYLRANYLSDDTDVLTLSGTAGDPIGNGLSLNIGGGDGADNQLYPSDISARSGASSVFTYSSGSWHLGGVRYDSGTFKTVYFAFGFEGINNQAHRDTVMARVLRWLDVALDIDEAGKHTPGSIAISVSPNPFNSSCIIQAYLPEEGDVNIIDLSGRIAKNLAISIPRGNHRFVFDASELTSGVYFVSVKTEKHHAMSKILLVR